MKVWNMVFPTEVNSLRGSMHTPGLKVGKFNTGVIPGCIIP